nr:ABC transporter ATP-binding protein [Actinomadura rayongensis]
MLASLPDVERLEAGIARSAVPLGGARPVGDLPRRTIRLEGVRFAFGDRPVLDGLDLDIPVGASTAIVGANGAGKTTLIRLLTRLHDPSGGRITVDGTDLADLDPADWQRRCALISQDFARLPFTLADNIGVGASRAALRAAAERAGAADLVAGLPDGWDTPLGVPGGRDLSRGQWQRVALARALYAAEHGARILVLDEPTAWLDAAAEADFHRRFLAMTRGLTTIIVAHRFSTVRRADRIHVLHDGKVAESGDHDTLLALDGRYAAMFTAQAARFAGEATAR